MTDLWVPNVRQTQVQPRILDKTGRYSSPISGNVRTVKRAGARWGFLVTYTSLTATERARLEPLLAWLGGAENRFLYSPGDHVQRGSFPSNELLVNHNFERGVAGWSTGADYSIVAADGMLQCIRVGSTVASNMLNQTIAGITPYAPIVCRAMTIEGRGTHTNIGPQLNSSEASFATTPGYRQLVYVPRTTSVIAGLVDFAPSGQMSGDYFNVPYMSVARCPLVDNGTNLLSNSDVPGGTGWTQLNANVGNNGTQAPDSTLAAQFLAETTANGQHYTSIIPTALSTGPRDVSYSVYVSPGNRSWCWLKVTETVGGSQLLAYFNLANAGIVGSTSVTVNFSDIRANIQNVGNGWYRVSITGHLNNGATALQCFLGSATGDNASSFVGASSGVALLTWRASVAQSSVPVRAVATAGASIPGGTLQSGSGLWVKGLPANTNGLLLVGDYFEINRELKKVTTSLNSDAFGIGYLQFSPPLRFAPNDNDPIVLAHPVGSFIASSGENGWTANPGIFSDISIDLVEAY